MTEYREEAAGNYKGKMGASATIAPQNGGK